MKKIIVIEASEQWSTVMGSVYGLQQPSITGNVTIRKIPDPLAQKIIKTIDALLEIHPETEEKSTKQALINKLPAWVAAVQKKYKISISKKYQIRQKSQSTDTESFWITLPTTHPEASKIAIRWIISVINFPYSIQQVNETKIKIKSSLEKLKTELKPFIPKGLNTHQILDAAYRLDIPTRKITSMIYMLGTGAHSRWIDSTITDQTPFLGVMTAQNKLETAKILRQAGLPGGENRTVKTADQAVEAARSFGFPVVVKPTDQEQGIGVMADLCDETIVRFAYEAARKVSNSILVERHVNGFTHRLSVMHDKVIRVTKRIAGGIVGDGVHDISELIAKLQHDPEYQRRAQSMGKQLISLDDEALSLIRQYGLKPSHILAPGEYLKLRRRDNVNAGASNQTCDLSRVHSDNIQLAIDAAALLRLDLAGIDLIIENIEQSWRNVDALICEVNARPQIVAPEDPLFYDGILRELMGEQFRIPLHLVIIPENPDLRHGLILKWMRQAPGKALSDTTGIWISGAPVTRGFDNGYQAAMAMLMRTSVHEAVCLMTLNDIRRKGLPSDQWSSVHVEKSRLFDDAELASLKRTLSLLAPGTLIRLLQDQKNT